MSAGKSKFHFLAVLALIAGAAVYFYNTAQPPTVKEESVTEHTNAGDSAGVDNAGDGYPAEITPQTSVPAGAAVGAEVTEQETVEMSCQPAEAFEIFYANFKADDEFKFTRTQFPLRKRVFSGAGEAQTEEVFEIRKEQILARDEMVYLDSVSASGYSEGIFANDPAQIDIAMGPEDSDPLTIHKFKQESGCWFLYEFISYEYSGSNSILAL